MAVWFSGFALKGGGILPCYSPLKGWRSENGGIQFRRPGGARVEKMEVACGQCLGCRLDYSRMWAMRIVHEASLYESDHGNSFITLTYRDRRECNEEQLNAGFHVPDDWSLCKKHFQDFMKRLRRRRKQKIRFFHVGEYGDICRHRLSTTGSHPDVGRCLFCRVGRPHYHACLINCTFADLQVVGERNGVTYFTSAELESIWKYGFVQVGEVNFQSAAYVARYLLKKVTGEAAQDHYVNVDDDGVVTFVLPEYVTMSRGGNGRDGQQLGGLGKGWLDKFQDDVYPSDEVPVPGKGVIKKAPRYYDDLLAVIDPQLHEEVKRLREAFREAHGEEYTTDRLMSKYKVKKAQVELLPRGL